MVAGDSGLEQLPAELLSIVFNHVGGFAETTKAPLIRDSISKSLLPFVRRILFHDITFRNVTRFLEFCEMAQGATDISHSVTRLAVQRDALVVLATETATILRFFANAPNLVTLYSSSPRISLLILSPQFAATLASAGSIINSLSMLAFTGGSGGSLVEDVRHLGKWRALRKLAVDYQPAGTRTGGEVDGLPAVRLANVTDLKVRVPGSRGDTPSFLSAFTGLSSLDIEYDIVLGPEGGHPLYRDIHNSLNHSTITKLAIKLPYTEYFRPPDPDTALLLDFTNLTHLFLNAPFLLEPLIVGIDKLPSLERITFGSNLEPGSVEIVRFFITPQAARPTSLKVIALEHFRYVSDTSAFSGYYESSDGEEEEGEWIEKFSHTVPIWTEIFSEADAFELEECAGEYGINLGREFRSALARVRAVEDGESSFDDATVGWEEGDEDSFGAEGW